LEAATRSYIGKKWHVDNPRNTEARNFLILLDSAGLQQHIDGPTHRDGHTLDLIITHCADTFISKLKILAELLSGPKRALCNVDFFTLAQPSRV